MKALFRAHGRVQGVGYRRFACREAQALGLAGWVRNEPDGTVAGEAVQLHGGIAITWEHDMQLYFKRAHSSAQLFGPPREQVRRLESEVL